MDFDDTLEEAAFRAEVRTWLTDVEPHPRGQLIDLCGGTRLKCGTDEPRKRYARGDK
jgi:hypothetical protein